MERGRAGERDRGEVESETERETGTVEERVIES